MDKKTKIRVLEGTAIAALGMGIGYALYSLKKTKKATIAQNEISDDINAIVDEYVEGHSDRHYIQLGTTNFSDNKKEGKQK